MSDNYKWHYRFLRLAAEVASWSKDPSTQVGAVIVAADRRVVSVGYNGFPRSMPDYDDLLTNREEKYSRIIHAEVNALIQAREPVDGCILYTYPFLPCDRCFVQMAQAGIDMVVAPKATAEALQRWGSAFEKVRQYADEMHIDLVEIEL